MGRHDIRLRRQKMTSRHIERYKDYPGLLHKHRFARVKRLIKLILLLLFFVALLLLSYLALSKLSGKKKEPPKAVTTTKTTLFDVSPSQTPGKTCLRTTLFRGVISGAGLVSDAVKVASHAGHTAYSPKHTPGETPRQLKS